MGTMAHRLMRAVRDQRMGWLAAGLVGVVVLALFFPAASGRGVFSFGDILSLHYPERAAYERALAAGELPLWSPDVMAGYPLLAEGQFSPLYPPSYLLHLLLPTELALNGFVILHFAWAGVGMYLLARGLKLSHAASVLSALTYMLGGFCVAHLNHLNIVAIAAWLPAFYLAARTAALRLRGGWRGAFRPLAATVACWAAILLIGHPQMAMLSLFIVAVGMVAQAVAPEDDAALEHPRRSGAAARTIAALAVVALLGAAQAAAQLLPTWELTRLSQRAGGLDPDFFASFSLHPAYLLLLFSPFPLGDPYPAISVEVVGYVGIVPLMLAAVAILGGRRRGALFWGAMALVSLLLALGRWNPLYILLLRVPVLNWFRVPARYLYGFGFAMAVLSGLGYDALAQRARASLRADAATLWPWAAAAAGSVAAVAGARALGAEGMYAVWRWLPLGLAVGGALAVGWLWRGCRPATAWLGACAALVTLDLLAFAATFGFSYNATEPREAFVAEPRVAAFLAADAGEEPYRVYTYEEIVPVPPVMRESLYPNLSMLHGINALGGNLPLTLTRYAEYMAEPTPRKLDLLNVRYLLIPQVLPVDEASEFYDLEDPFAPTLVGRHVTFAGLRVRSVVVESYVSHSVDLADGVVAAEVVLLDRDAERARLPLRIGLDTAEWAYPRSDVRANIRHSRPGIARAWPARSGFPPENHEGYVYRAEYALAEAVSVTALEVLPRELPRAYIRVERVILIDENGEPHLLAHLIGEGDHTLAYRSEDVAIYRNNDALPRAYLVHRARPLAERPALLAALADPAYDLRSEVLLAEGDGLDVVAPAGDEVQVTLYESSRVELRARSEAEGYLVLADAYYPGWEATVDGQPVPIREANGYVRAVRLAAGEHEVVFRYRPASFRWGAAVSLAAVALLLVGAWRVRRSGV